MNWKGTLSTPGIVHPSTQMGLRVESTRNLFAFFVTLSKRPHLITTEPSGSNDKR